MNSLKCSMYVLKFPGNSRNRDQVHVTTAQNDQLQSHDACHSLEHVHAKFLAEIRDEVADLGEGEALAVQQEGSDIGWRAANNPTRGKVLHSVGGGLVEFVHS